MRPCFACGCDWVCGHREPELVAWEYRIRRRMAALDEHQATQTPVVSRKPPANAPAGSNGVITISKKA
jgi:hypothetical protein